MSDRSNIEWTDATWNPVRGCTRVSGGCRNCYAERVAARFSGPGMPYEGLAVMRNGEPRWTGEVRMIEKHLEDPLRWTKPRRIFVNSMSDLFHEDLPFEEIDRIFAVMARAPQHTFQILTKRPARMLEYLTESHARARGVLWDLVRFHVRHFRWPLQNVWLGVSAENQATAEERIPQLLEAPAVIRFLSAEPLLGQLELEQWLAFRPRLDWIIVGGESGPAARPMHPNWARYLRDQCGATGTAFFFKQWGEWSPRPHCRGQMLRVGKANAGRLLDGIPHDEFPNAH